MGAPQQVWSDGTRLFVAEFSNHRVLIFNRIPTTNGAAADIVIGQPDMTSGAANQGGNPGPNTLRGPVGVWSDGNRLIIGESENHRILIFNRIPTANNASADVVIGQADFTTRTSGCAANKLGRAQGVFSDGKRLIAAEWNNARILIWNSVPTTSNVSADVVVGQKDFTSCAVNQGGSAAANTFGINNFGPTIYAGRLFVPDRNNNRVLVWNRIPTENNTPADIVIGQPNFTTTSAGTTAAKLNAPRTVFSDGKRLFITDDSNSRVLIFNIGSSAIDLSPQFKQGKAVLGKVFWDLNGNGRQDRVLPSLPGTLPRNDGAVEERGIEGVKVVSDTGIYAITDQDGKYHFPFIETGQRLLKIDPSTLPEGAIITTESPRKVTITEGILTKVSFGVKLPEASIEHRAESIGTPSAPSPLHSPDLPFLQVSISEDATKLSPHLFVSAKEEKDRIIFTIQCNYFLFIERAELKLYDQNYELLRSIPLPKPLPLYYELPQAEISTHQSLFYQLSVFDKEGREDRTGIGVLRIS
ncbi:MAG: hypothetical protein A3G87_10375 [Omnitrophica bacterium RIFCSPLOWO2_12_FULL_50_11]|nr:MAG: hypothetical protein A3G87_10375 [Omnitrophica bacterium RIFCSPLOWO2_12_FULL_50_11]